MRRCICFCHSLDVSTISLMVDEKLVYTHTGNTTLDRYLNGTKIDELCVVVKPSVAKTIPEDGFRLGDFSQDGFGRVCVISENDVNNLIEISKVFEVPNVKVYNYLEIISLKFTNYDKVIVLTEWVDSTVALVYLEFGVIKAFKVSAESKLSYNISVFKKKYDCYIVEDSKVSDFVGLRTRVSNSSSIKESDRNSINYLRYMFDLKGIPILGGNKAFNLMDEEEEEEISYSSKFNEDGSPIDKDSLDNPNLGKKRKQVKDSKLGFFARMFGKKSKKESTKQNGNFIKYDDDFKRQMSLNQMSYGDSSSSYNNVGSLGYQSSVLAARQKSISDYFFYVFIIVVFACILFSFTFSSIYRMKVSSLSSLNKEIESTLHKLSGNNSKSSPIDNVLNLASVSVPNGCEVSKVDYSNDNIYKLEIDSDKALDDVNVLSDSLPNDVIVSNIDHTNNTNYNSEVQKRAITYALTLVIP